MGKRVMLALAVAGMVLAMAGPAFAKGDHEELVSVSGTVKGDGPGLRVPFILGTNGPGCGIIDPCSSFAEYNERGDFLQMATDVGITGFIPPYARDYYVRPPMSKLGPGYHLHWRFVASDGSVSEVDQTLYPYAPGRPWVYTPPGQAVFHIRPLEFDWISVTPQLRTLMQGYGFPKASPVAGTGTSILVDTATEASSTWLWAVVVGVLLILLMAAGVIAGRRRTGLRTA